MKEIKTTYGAFKAGEDPGMIALHNMKNEAIGANIYMKFTPNELVTDADQFGFVQVASMKSRGVYQAPDKETKEHMVKKRGASKGYFVDQLSGLLNPLYATGSKAEPGQENELGGYTDSDVHQSKEHENDDGLIKDRKWAGFGQFGSKKNDVSQDATFQDAPHLYKPIKNSADHFETSVLITKGKQAGTYLGSVKWGFKLKGKGEISLEEPELVSSGTPSKTFADAAKLWNETSAKVNGDNKKHIPLPEIK